MLRYSKAFFFFFFTDFQLLQKQSAHFILNLDFMFATMKGPRMSNSVTRADPESRKLGLLGTWNEAGTSCSSHQRSSQDILPNTAAEHVLFRIKHLSRWGVAETKNDDVPTSFLLSLGVLSSHWKSSFTLITLQHHLDCSRPQLKSCCKQSRLYHRDRSLPILEPKKYNEKKQPKNPWCIG